MSFSLVIIMQINRMTDIIKSFARRELLTNTIRVLKSIQELLINTGSSRSIAVFEQLYYSIAIKRTSILNVPLEDLGVIITRKNESNSKENEYLLTSVLNMEIIYKQIKIFLDQNQEYEMKTFSTNNKIIDSFGEELLETKIWKEMYEKLQKKFRNSSSENKAPLKICHLKESGFEISAWKIIIDQ